jgi:PAS domain S-box-containing protein
MIDLKETKRVKDELAANPENYQDIINSSKLAICITGSDAKFVAVNDNYVKLYGYKREDLVGREFTVVLPEENKKSLLDYHARFFVDKYEIIRKWVVKNKSGQLMEIFADAGYNDKIKKQPNKVTLIQFMRNISELPKEEGFAHVSVKG